MFAFFCFSIRINCSSSITNSLIWPNVLKGYIKSFSIAWLWKTYFSQLGWLVKIKLLIVLFKVKSIEQSAMYLFFNAVVYTRCKLIYRPFSSKPWSSQLMEMRSLNFLSSFLGRRIARECNTRGWHSPKS